jgi:glycosyltransferase involved in cell wall biosynthesis
MLKLSLVITTKNRARYFERALAALIREKREGYPNTEIVVTDAGSTDGTADVVRKNEAHIDRWISKSDSGVSEGVNRAFAMATGDVIWATGDDDIIVSGSSVKMMDYLKHHPEIDVVFGHHKIFVESEDGMVKESTWLMPYTVGKVTKRTICRFLYADFVVPETGFFRKRVVDLVGGYDLRLHYFAFWDFFFRLEKAGARMWTIPELVIHRHTTPVSDTLLGPASPRWKQEYDSVAYRHGGVYWLVWHRCSGKITVRKVLAMCRKDLGARFNIHPRKWRDEVLARWKSH